MKIIQSISDKPNSTLIKREVVLKQEYFRENVLKIDAFGALVEDNSYEISAQYLVLEYIMENAVKKYVNIREIEYKCSNTARIVPTGSGLLYVTDSSFENFVIYPTERDFVMNLKLKSKEICFSYIKY